MSKLAFNVLYYITTPVHFHCDFRWEDKKSWLEARKKDLAKKGDELKKKIDEKTKQGKK